MTTLATQQATVTGTVLTFSPASSGGDKFKPDEHTAVIIRNDDAGAHVVTIETPRTGPGGAAIADLTKSVGAGEIAIFGPFDPDDFRDTADGLTDISYDGVTSVTVAAVRV